MECLALSFNGGGSPSGKRRRLPGSEEKGLGMELQLDASIGGDIRAIAPYTLRKMVK